MPTASLCLCWRDVEAWGAAMAVQCCAVSRRASPINFPCLTEQNANQRQRDRSMNFVFSVLASGCCPRLHLFVCACVHPCVNDLIHVITHRLFKLGSLNLDQRCKPPWLRFILFCRAIDIDLKVKLNLKFKIYHILSLSMP